MVLSSTKRALIAVFALALLVSGAAGVYLFRLHRQLPAISSGKPPDILSLLPPDAPVVLYIDAAALRGLQGSPLAAVLGLTNPSPKQDKDYAEFVRETGFNYERDLDHASVALWPAGMATPDHPLGDDQVFVIADGRFDSQKIEAYALRTGHIERRGTKSVYEVPGEPPIAFQFLSADRIAIATGKKGDTLLGEPTPQAPDGAMQARMNRVAGSPLFGVARMDRFSDRFYDNFLHAPQASQLIRSIRSISLSAKPQGENMRLVLDAESDTMKNAFEISTLLDGLRLFGSMAIADPGTRRRMTKQQYAFARDFLKHVAITHQDRWVRLTLDVTPEMLATAPASSSPHAPAGSR